MEFMDLDWFVVVLLSFSLYIYFPHCDAKAGFTNNLNEVELRKDGGDFCKNPKMPVHVAETASNLLTALFKKNLI